MHCHSTACQCIYCQIIAYVLFSPFFVIQIRRGEEILIDYKYNLATAPAWYKVTICQQHLFRFMMHWNLYAKELGKHNLIANHYRSPGRNTRKWFVACLTGRQPWGWQIYPIKEEAGWLLWQKLILADHGGSRLFSIQKLLHFQSNSYSHLWKEPEDISKSLQIKKPLCHRLVGSNVCVSFLVQNYDES